MRSPLAMKRQARDLVARASGIFFHRDVEGRILFRADNNGKTDALIDRRNNEDVAWRKVK
jgi:hypothetical protein